MKKYKVKKDFTIRISTNETLLQANEYSDLFIIPYSGDDVYIKESRLKSLPDGFEEVKEMEWEIQSFHCIGSNDQYFNKRSDGTYAWKYVAKAYDYLMNSNAYAIHSVKRLSDGEVFTIGDRLVSYDSPIKSFYIKAEEMYVIVNYSMLSVHGTWALLIGVTKLKEPTDASAEVFGMRITENTKYLTHMGTRFVREDLI